jgi:hypothetical protein
LPDQTSKWHQEEQKTPMTTIIFLLLAFQVKHFIVDFPMQTPFQWQNKGTYGHLGGILHAGLHAAATLAILMLFNIPFIASFLLALAEGIVHYHIDWAKMNINRAKGWECNKHAQFWVLLGFDQLLHQLTYIALLWAVVEI